MTSEEHKVQLIQGLLLARENREALDLSREWLENAPDNPQAWFISALCRHMNDDIDGALEAFDQVLGRIPEHIQALSGRAGMLARKGEHRLALATYREAIELSGNDPDLRLNEALMLETLEQLPEALECYDKATRLHPEHQATLMNRGLLLARMLRFDEAIRQGEAVAERFSDQVMPQINYAEILLRASHYAQSLEACERALTLDADNIAALIIKTIGLAALGRMHDAVATHAAACRDPIAADTCCRSLLGAQNDGIGDLAVGDIWFRVAWQRLCTCDWRHYDEDSALARRLFSAGIEGIPALTDSFYCQPLQNFSIDDSIHRQHALRLAKQVQRALQPQVFIARQAVPETRLRVAYLLTDLDEDPLLPLFLSLLRGHQRQLLHITVYCCCAADGRALLAPLRQMSDAFVDLSELSDRDAAYKIYQDEINLLVEVNPYAERARPSIMAYKPAPVQVWYAGHSGTSGAPWMDYALVDRLSSPVEGRPYWTEQRALLPAPAITLSIDDCVAHATPRQELGLPADSFVFCSFNRPEKIEPLVFGAWMRMLLRVPGSVLWLQAYSQEGIDHLVAEADYRGVAKDRLLFTLHEPDRNRYLAHLAAADMYLDTFLHNGFARTVDALLAGVAPLVCRGTKLVGRRSAALLNGMDLDELVCPDLEAYESLAVALATDRERLDAIRQALCRNRKHSRLFDVRRQVTDLEAAYAHMWAAYKDNQAVEEFSL